MWHPFLLVLLYPVHLLAVSIGHSAQSRGLLDPIFAVPDIVTSLGELTSGDIISDIISYFDFHPDIAAAFPGLRDVLASCQTNETSSENVYRGLLRSIKEHSAFTEAFDELDTELQGQVTAFLNGTSAASIVSKRGFVTPPSPAAKRHFKHMQESGITPASRRWLNARRDTTPVIYEDDAKTKVMTVYAAAEFDNWGLTVSNTPSYTFVPTTVVGVQNLMQYAIANGKRVRAAGYRHTWTNMYSEDNEIFVSMLDLETATAVPDPSSLLPDTSINGANEFKAVILNDTDVAGSGGTKRLARIGAAVTNEEFRRWSIANGWTLPLNVIMVEITLGGSNVPICHGGGIGHQTLSDLVRVIEYVDAKGVHRSISNTTQLQAAAGSLGLLGVVTHVTLELDKMTYADMRPLKQDVNLAIPPPPDFTVPTALKKSYTQAELDEARETFIADAENSYYSEYFWFPYQQRAFVNVWNNTEDATGLIDYPAYPELFLEWVEGWVGGVLNDDALFRLLPGHWQAVILSSAAMLALPPQLDIIGTDIRTYLIDALHFRRGVQNMRVRDMELQIPIPPSASDPSKPDWTVVQQAWWDAIETVYEDATAPMRIALEMRIMADSDMILAPQRNNTFGTASIEVLTSMAAVAEGVWIPFAQKVADKWMSYEANGQRLKTRPHWAKEWDGMTVDGSPWKNYLRDVSYKEEIPVFKSLLADIGQSQNWTVADLQARFSCSLLDDIIFSS